MSALRPKLTVHLDILAANYQLLKARHAKHMLSAVVKADAYGLGVKAVAARLWQEGCRVFFVATLDEAVQLRKLMPDARIGVFNGLLAGEEKLFLRHRVAPVLNDLSQVERWMNHAPVDAPVMLHVDTGMTRLGLSYTELERVVRTYPTLRSSLAYVLSHLACANVPEHPKNAEQLARFREMMRLLPDVKASFANSSGLFLPAEYHFDLGRPGCALYGISPIEGANPMQQVVTLSAPVLQLRRLEHDEAVGYGATAKLYKGNKLLLVALGYADGWPRNLSNTGFATVAGQRVPIVGRVSMDMTALDVSTLSDGELASVSEAEFINAQQTVDDVAHASGTIGYEILTGLGARVARVVA